jgi:hypothetical protein
MRPTLVPWHWDEGIVSTNDLIKGTVFRDCVFIKKNPVRMTVEQGKIADRV